jgi:hypothetical protein
MVKLKLGKKDKDADGAPAAEAVDAAPASDAGDDPAGDAVVAESAPAVYTPPPAPAEAAVWEPTPARFDDSVGAPAPLTGGVGGLFNRMYGDVGEQTAAERDRVAALEFQQAMAPALELLQASVPEASNAEEAARILEQRQAQTELVADPKGGAYVNGDAYETDARIYYRLLRRDYEKTPRPSEKRATSHHLHQVYGKLTGNKGW